MCSFTGKHLVSLYSWLYYPCNSGENNLSGCTVAICKFYIWTWQRMDNFFIIELGRPNKYNNDDVETDNKNVTASH